MTLTLNHKIPAIGSTLTGPHPAAHLTPARTNPPWVDWLTMFLLIGNTANPFFYQSVEMLFASFIVLLAIWFFAVEDNTRLNQHFWIYIIVLTLLQACQIIEYHLFPVKTFMGEYLRIAFSVLAIRIIGRRFFDQFVEFVYVFGVISLCFYIPCVLVKPLAHFLTDHVAKYTQSPFHRTFTGDMYDSPGNLIIYNLGQIDLKRNSGFYWEPGTQGGFMCLALFINLFYRKEKLSSKVNLIFILVILTTLSTTTYLALFFVIIAHLKGFFIKRPFIALFLLLGIVGFGFLAYQKLDFLHKKIDQQIEKSNSQHTGESRFSSLNADLASVKEHPLIGTGRNVEMHYGKNFYNTDIREMHRNNGIGVLLSTYGLPFFFFFLYFNWLSFRRLLNDPVNAALLLTLLLIISFSEDYFFKAFFIGLALYCGITMPADNHPPVTRSGNRPAVTRSGKMQLGSKTLTHEFD
jgi:hypothetical protein